MKNLKDTQNFLLPLDYLCLCTIAQAWKYLLIEKIEHGGGFNDKNAKPVNIFIENLADLKYVNEHTLSSECDEPQYFTTDDTEKMNINIHHIAEIHDSVSVVVLPSGFNFDNIGNIVMPVTTFINRDSDKPTAANAKGATTYNVLRYNETANLRIKLGDTYHLDLYVPCLGEEQGYALLSELSSVITNIINKSPNYLLIDYINGLHLEYLDCTIKGVAIK
jgi:hypothetical protein